MKLHRVDPTHLAFHCPACDGAHMVQVNAAQEPNWEWNGRMDLPTFLPSIRVRGVKMTPQGEKDFEEWCTSGKPGRDGKPFETKPLVCHSWVKAGKIEYCGDSTHELAGKVVELPAWDGWAKQ